jgi:AAA domain
MTTLQPPHCLLFGPAGSGKTSSLATFAQFGIDVFVVVTEPTGVDSLLDSWARLKLDPKLLHYCVVPPASAGWQAMKDLGVRINNMSYKDLSEIKSGIGKEKMKQYPKLLDNLENFHDEHSGADFGDVTTWGADRVLAIDSLSGISLITLQHTVGFKPSPHQGEWGIAMSAVEMLILKLSSDCNCFFVLTSHQEKEPDEITGMAKVTVSTLGRKLAPKIPRFFSEVIRTRKDAAGKFLWSTMDSEADLKNRALPSSSSIPASFEPIIKAYQARRALAESQKVAGSAVPALTPSPPQAAE